MNHISSGKLSLAASGSSTFSVGGKRITKWSCQAVGIGTVEFRPTIFGDTMTPAIMCRNQTIIVEMPNVSSWDIVEVGGDSVQCCLDGEGGKPYF